MEIIFGLVMISGICTLIVVSTIRPKGEHKKKETEVDYHMIYELQVKNIDVQDALYRLQRDAEKQKALLNELIDYVYSKEEK